MNASMMNSEENQPRLKVSVTARLIAAFAYTIPAIGGALSSILLMNVFQALRENESAGIIAVMAGMKEASLPALVSIYLAAIFGLIVIAVLIARMIVPTKTSSPPIWFFIFGGVLCLVPAGLFWKAQLLVIEVLSPGSSIGAGGMASAGADLSRLLVLSVIAAPIVFILLVVASVVPLSSRSKRKWSSLFAAAAVEVLLIATAVAIPFLINGPKRINEIVNLPANVKNADDDYDIERESSMILTLTSDNKLYLRQKSNVPDKLERTENITSREELPEKLIKFFEMKSPEKRIVYLKADVNVSYENVLQLFDIIRKADIDKVGLVVVGAKNEDDPYQINPLRFEVKLPQPIDKGNEVLKPNPLTLVAMLENDGKMLLNNEAIGMISDTKHLEIMLVRVFKDRENNGIFREGTNEIEKTVFLKVSKSSKYGDFIKLVEAVKNTNANPIGIQIDDIKPIGIQIDDIN